MDISVELHCDRCGSANLSLPPPQDDAGLIRCNDCGQTLGTLADLRAGLIACAFAQSAETLRSNLPQGGGSPQ